MEKKCSMCLAVKDISAFQKRSQTRDGYHQRCKECDGKVRIERKIRQGRRRPDPPQGHKWCKKCDTEKPLNDFYTKKSGPHEGKVTAHCRTCVKADNIARARARGVSEWSPANPRYLLMNRLSKKYSITLQQYDDMLSDQDGKCLGCRISQAEYGKNFCVDHDHSCCPGDTSCGKCIRGLLCPGCNFAISHVKDNPQILRNLASYLDSYVIGAS